MPNASDIKNLVKDLHDRKIIDGSTSIEKMLSISADQIVGKNKGELAGWYAVGGEHYVIICGLEAAKQQVTLPALNQAGPGR